MKLFERLLRETLRFLGYEIFPLGEVYPHRKINDQTPCRELVVVGLRKLAETLKDHPHSYNPHEDEFIWAVLAYHYWPELADHYLDGYAISLYPGWSCIAKTEEVRCPAFVFGTEPVAKEA